MIVLSSQFDPGFEWSPHGLPVSIALCGRCVQKLSLGVHACCGDVGKRVGGRCGCESGGGWVGGWVGDGEKLEACEVCVSVVVRVVVGGWVGCGDVKGTHSGCEYGFKSGCGLSVVRLEVCDSGRRECGRRAGVTSVV
jgi:hypothetical protein